MVSNIEAVDEIETDEVADCKASSLRGEHLMKMTGFDGFADRPFIVRGRAADWPALKKWDFKWIQDINVTADVRDSLHS